MNQRACRSVPANSSRYDGGDDGSNGRGRQREGEGGRRGEQREKDAKRKQVVAGGRERRGILLSRSKRGIPPSTAASAGNDRYK